jgi:hypothetical protein
MQSDNASLCRCKAQLTAKLVWSSPMLAEKVPAGDGWLKHDGFRIIARKEGERLHLWVPQWIGIGPPSSGAL